MGAAFVKVGTVGPSSVEVVKKVREVRSALVDMFAEVIVT